VLDKVGTLCTLLEPYYDREVFQLDGNKCTRTNLQAIINDMEVEDNDVIITYYSGHGSHAMNDAGDPWPQYLMNSGFENQGNWVPMALLIKWIKAKNARLSIIVSDCCNLEQEATTIKPRWADDGRATELDKLNAQNYKTLFDAKGCVMVTSSKLGQVSWGNKVYGGYFTCDFLDVMNMVGTGHIAPDWESILKKTYELCSARKIRTNEYPYIASQNPFYKNETGKNNVTIPIKPPTTDNPSSLIEALSKITNKTIDQDVRIDMISAIENKYFDSGAKVITVGNDMTTQFEYEDVHDFLRRICMSPYIKGINVLNESRTLLRVHEIR